MCLPRVAVAATLAAAVTIPALSASAAYARPVPQSAAARSPGEHAKPMRHHFAAVGSIAVVDSAGATVTVAATAGTKDAKGHTVTIAVPAVARILVNGKRARLAALQQGYRITVTGTRVGTAYIANKIEATTPRPRTRPTPAPGSSTAPPAPAPSTQPSESIQPSLPSELADDPTGNPSDEPAT